MVQDRLCLNLPSFYNFISLVLIPLHVRLTSKAKAVNLIIGAKPPRTRFPQNQHHCQMLRVSRIWTHYCNCPNLVKIAITNGTSTKFSNLIRRGHLPSRRRSRRLWWRTRRWRCCVQLYSLHAINSSVCRQMHILIIWKKWRLEKNCHLPLGHHEWRQEL